jgi:hypothetical protein
MLISKFFILSLKSSSGLPFFLYQSTILMVFMVLTILVVVATSSLVGLLEILEDQMLFANKLDNKLVKSH